MTAASYADLPPKDVEWLWQDRIALGELTLIAGAGGIGKGYMLADLTARVTRGALMPDGTEHD